MSPLEAVAEGNRGRCSAPCNSSKGDESHHFRVEVPFAPDVSSIGRRILDVSCLFFHFQISFILRYFQQYVGLSQDQLTAIREGQAVSMKMASHIPDEIFVFGAVFVNRNFHFGFPYPGHHTRIRALGSNIKTL